MQLLCAIIHGRPESQCWLSGHFVRGVILMASIAKRGNSYSVVYMTTIQGQQKQKWETYHSLDEAEQRKRILDLCQKIKTRRNEHIDTVGDLMERYILFYGQIKWFLKLLKLHPSFGRYIYLRHLWLVYTTFIKAEKE